jgi:hypothetical protein
MSVLNKLACSLGRRDEVPNQELARELAEADNAEGVRELAENLWNKDRNIQNDCIKALYEVGYLKPELIAPYAGDLLKLLCRRNNRLVWGVMLALSTIADISADALYPHYPNIIKTMESGSVITVDAGVEALAKIASTSDERRRTIFPYLLKHLQTCRPKSVPQHAEKAVLAVSAENKKEFVAVLEKRMEALQGAQVRRVKKVIKQAQQH